MGLDSVELLIIVENHFAVTIPDAEAEKASTVGKLVDTVARHIGATTYDFSLRNELFKRIKDYLLALDPAIDDFSITSLVGNSLKLQDEILLKEIENKLNLKFPGIKKNTGKSGLWTKFKTWFNDEDIDLKRITWKKYIDILLAFNLENLDPPIRYKSKYEIYIAIMKITVDKMAVSYQEIGIEKIFTDDLGVD
jgi:hypothetical protein